MPEIEGEFGILGLYDSATVSGAFAKQTRTGVDGGFGSNGGRGNIRMAASLNNVIYGGSNTVMPPSINTPHAIYLGATD